MWISGVIPILVEHNLAKIGDSIVSLRPIRRKRRYSQNTTYLDHEKIVLDSDGDIGYDDNSQSRFTPDQMDVIALWIYNLPEKQYIYLYGKPFNTTVRGGTNLWKSHPEIEDKDVEEPKEEEKIEDAEEGEDHMTRQHTAGLQPVTRWEILKESPEEQSAGHRFNPGLVLLCNKQRFPIASGAGDDVDVLTDGESLYVVSMNQSLGYVGMEVFSLDPAERARVGGHSGECFFQNDWDVKEVLGENWEDMPIEQIAQTLQDYCQA